MKLRALAIVGVVLILGTVTGITTVPRVAIRDSEVARS
jgi:hypothetical protein